MAVVLGVRGKRQGKRRMTEREGKDEGEGGVIGVALSSRLEHRW
jgi:hypothetical protein